ncbi:N-acetylmuramoyl-L-alanine amidase AmiD [Rubrivivax sp. A210]|uniref:peptidoglycan recognition protein family protein n=1 Tax=Rubrivivax sp. A210 TaxID=2772301 RepID=UPI00191B0706|nr:N-acetylmuramoyl-L-alanine amidase [Rubrivivax sp. A210]CAD5373277.1 N-acetylmuramoyl-L-alanine amidase AmiD [Rubrivivax sp. A210]
MHAPLHALTATLLALTTLALAGCALAPNGPAIDDSRRARGQDSRVLFVVLHYTVGDFRRAMQVLTEGEVSAHYLLSDEVPPRIYRLVDETRRAWHSGNSAWQGHRLLNASSIGIEIVHPGPRTDGEGRRVDIPFPEAQIEALIPLLRDIAARHAIRPERILGHGEVSPSYKEDPGPTFPWRRLAEAGLTPPWPDAAAVTAQQALFEAAPPEAAWYQQALARHGYAVEPSGSFDAQTARVLMNFQMRYRPVRFDGRPDAETAALLQVLTRP